MHFSQTLWLFHVIFNKIQVTIKNYISRIPYTTKLETFHLILVIVNWLDQSDEMSD